MKDIDRTFYIKTVSSEWEGGLSGLTNKIKNKYNSYICCLNGHSNVLFQILYAFPKPKCWGMDRAGGHNFSSLVIVWVSDTFQSYTF